LQLKAAKGEPIEEADDLYKEIEVWKKNVLVGERLKKNEAAIKNLIEKIWNKFTIKLKSELSVFNDLFETNSIVQKYFKKVKEPDSDSYLGESKFVEIENSSQPNIVLIMAHYILTRPKIDNLKDPTTIDCFIEFNENKYSLKSREMYNKIEKHYNEIPTNEEVDQFLKALVKSVYEKMKC